MMLSLIEEFQGKMKKKKEKTEDCTCPTVTFDLVMT